MNDQAELGGRLPLLSVAALTSEQTNVRQRLVATRGERGDAAGYVTQTDDGRLIGPFNAYLRVPEIAEPLLGLAEAVSSGPLPPTAREAVILAVVASWGADYAIYAHRAAAVAAGISAADVAALADGEDPRGLDEPAASAYRVCRALLDDHDVPDELFAAARGVLGDAGLVTVAVLVGQYVTTASVLACFRVPVPTP